MQQASQTDSLQCSSGDVGPTGVPGPIGSPGPKGDRGPQGHALSGVRYNRWGRN